MLIQMLHPAPGALLTSNDLLSCGPLPPFESISTWRQTREAYLQSLDDDASEPFSFSTSPRDLITNAAGLQDAESIVLWVGTGLGEQLLLAWVVQLLRLLHVPISRLAVVQFARNPAGPDFDVVAVGVLNPAGLAAHPAPAPLSADAVTALDAAWSAVTAPNPERLVGFLARPDPALPRLRRALAGLLPRFPDATSGLNRWEWELLRQVADQGPEPIPVVGSTLAATVDTGDLVGAAYLFARLRRMASRTLERPLLTMSGNARRRGDGRVELTAAGRAVLAGERNAVALNGIDDWVGGTHLDSRTGQVWFHRAGQLVRL